MYIALQTHSFMFTSIIDYNLQIEIGIIKPVLILIIQSVFKLLNINFFVMSVLSDSFVGPEVRSGL